MYLNLTVNQVEKLIGLLSEKVERSPNPEDVQYFLDDDAWLLRHLESRVTAEKSEQSCAIALDEIPF